MATKIPGRPLKETFAKKSIRIGECTEAEREVVAPAPDQYDWYPMLANIPEPFRRAAIRSELRLARGALRNLKRLVARLESLLKGKSE